MIIDLPKPQIPDMQAVSDEADRHLQALAVFLDTLSFVEPVDKSLLIASHNNLDALKATLQLAIRLNDRGDTAWEEFEK